MPGAQVPFMRSENTASDYATTADVILEVWNLMREWEEVRPGLLYLSDSAFCNSECTKDCHDAAGTGKIRLRYSCGEILLSTAKMCRHQSGEADT